MKVTVSLTVHMQARHQTFEYFNTSMGSVKLLVVLHHRTFGL